MRAIPHDYGVLFMAKKPSTGEYFTIDLKGKSKEFLKLYATIDDAINEAKQVVADVGPKLIAQAKKDGFKVPDGKEARVVQNRFGGNLQIVVDFPRGSSAKTF